jgi:rubrerythrin
MEKTPETKEEEEKDFGISKVDFTDESGIEWFGDEVWKCNKCGHQANKKEFIEKGGCPRCKI